MNCKGESEVSISVAVAVAKVVIEVGFLADRRARVAFEDTGFDGEANESSRAVDRLAIPSQSFGKSVGNSIRFDLGAVFGDAIATR